MNTIRPQSARKIKKIIPYTIIWLIAGVLYLFIERGLLGNSPTYPSTGNIYDFTLSSISILLGTFTTGTVIGFFEVTLGKNIFIKKTFGVKIFLKTIAYVMIIFLFIMIISIVTTSVQLNLSIWHPDVLDSFQQFVLNFAFWSVMIYSGAFMFFALFVSEVIDNLGINVLINFFTGKYQQPKAEERIFMFLDMKSSTTIAEQIGHVSYYKLLNAYYEDMTEAIIETYGEIYQYVGDEIVISWDLKEGLDQNNCIQCFFMIKERITARADKYIQAYGVVPKFKAALHYGKVTTGEIGVIKKDILFTGDVLNTTARIQGMCNEVGKELLVSSDLRHRLVSDHKFMFENIGTFELRGKDNKVELCAIQLI